MLLRKLGRCDRIFVLSACGALCISLVLGYFTKGFRGDLGIFAYWGRHGFSLALLHTYDAESPFYVYPPVALYLFAALHHVGKWLELSTAGPAWYFLLRAPSILAIFVGAFLVRDIVRRLRGERAALMSGIFFAFNPALIVDAAVFGQIDALLVLGLVAVVWSCIARREWLAGPVMAVTVLVKPTVVIVLPVFVLGAILLIGYRKFVVTFSLGLVTGLAPILPFIVAGAADVLLRSQLSSPGYFPVKSVLGGNFWCLYQVAEKLAVGEASVSAAGKSFLGIVSCRFVGSLIYSLLLVLVLRNAWPRKSWETWIAALFLAWFAAFYVLTGVGARYVVPAAGLSVLLAGRNRRYALICAGISISAAVNVLLVYLYSQSPGIPWPLFAKVVKCLIAIVNCGILAAALHTFFTEPDGAGGARSLVVHREAKPTEPWFRTLISRQGSGLRCTVKLWYND